MDWYTLFRQHILDRGIEYYEDGYVIDFNYSDDEILAQVDGTEVYDVHIMLDGEEVTELISKIPEDKVRELLVGFVLADEWLKNNLQMQYDFQMNSKLMLELRTEVDQIVYRHSNGGYVDWYHASEFTSELECFLNTKVMLLIEKNCLVDDIVRKSRYEDFICKLLYEGKRYDELMTKIEQSSNKVGLLDFYDKILRKTMPE